jgi:hypothetical protein
MKQPAIHHILDQASRMKGQLRQQYLYGHIAACPKRSERRRILEAAQESFTRKAVKREAKAA